MSPRVHCLPPGPGAWCHWPAFTAGVVPGLVPAPIGAGFGPTQPQWPRVLPAGATYGKKTEAPAGRAADLVI
jgi:hypothetical protein